MAVMHARRRSWYACSSAASAARRAGVNMLYVVTLMRTMEATELGEDGATETEKTAAEIGRERDGRWQGTRGGGTGAREGGAELGMRRCSRAAASSSSKMAPEADQIGVGGGPN